MKTHGNFKKFWQIEACRSINNAAQARRVEYMKTGYTRGARVRDILIIMLHIILMLERIIVLNLPMRKTLGRQFAQSADRRWAIPGLGELRGKRHDLICCAIFFLLVGSTIHIPPNFSLLYASISLQFVSAFHAVRTLRSR